MRTLCGFALLFFVGAVLGADTSRKQSFDLDWRFFRGEAPGAERAEFDDSVWRRLDVPHDWSIEDLPPTAKPRAELEVVTGAWRFHPGDDANWKAREFDDSAWQDVTLPDNWERHSNHDQPSVYGWFRRRVKLPQECQGQDVELLLGRIDDVDEVWLNGQRLGQTGEFPPGYRTAWDQSRRYRAVAALWRADGENVLAVRVFDGEGNGGIYQAGMKSVRVGPFDPVASEGADATGYTVGGVGWYRKQFTLPIKSPRVAVRFDGVYMDADVWLNGQHLGQHPHGYTSFELELTPHLRPAGEPNVLAVRVRNVGKNSRWYSGSGIYRHVWLTSTDSVHIPTWGLFVTTSAVSRAAATVQVAVEVNNSSAAPAPTTVRVTLRNVTGEVVGRTESELRVTAGTTRSVAQSLTVKSPRLWSLESPNMYVAKAEVIVAGKVVDRVTTPFGIRQLEVDAKQGLRLNGEPLKLRGGCLHHDNGPLGAVAIDRAEERRIELLKANGFNAVRTSHNPPSPALLNACDRLGMLVIDEAFDQWSQQKLANAQDHHRFFTDWLERDIATMVRRDRNHPSVIMWSVGNEIPEQFRAVKMGQRLRKAVLTHDATRLVTQAICSDWGAVIRDWDALSDPAFGHLDVAGYNYLVGKYQADHARHPERVIYGSESYPKQALEYWEPVEQHSYVIGDFVWTAMDYLGEAGIAHSVPSTEPESFFMPWPWFNAWCGDLDLCGFKKPQSYYRDVVWRRSPLELAVHTPLPAGATEIVSGWGWPNEQRSWNWPGHEGQPLEVAVYARCEHVRLELNGKVLGEQPVSIETKLTARFRVPYAAGELKAYGLVDNEIIATQVLRTTGAPHKIKLTADRATIFADRNDLAYVTVEVVDAAGQRVPNAELPVQLFVTGAGSLAAQASGSPNAPASFQASQRTTFEGRCLVILRPTDRAGGITLRAEAEGLESAAITVQTQAREANRQ